MTKHDEPEINFDTNSGISEEEQREILAAINGIAEKNRQSLSSGIEGSVKKGRGSKPLFKAKKSGGFFPILVNIAAVTVLTGGFLILSAVHGKTDAEVREGTKVYNSAERALIDEIRKETSSRLEAKENEIAQIAGKLEDIDLELQELHSSNQELTAEQQAAENRLKALQDEYRNTLSHLHDERSLILEEAREREAALQAQLENRTRELAHVAEQSAAAIDLAKNEMDRLTREQAQASSVEAQMSAFFANLNGQIRENRLDEAAVTLQSMRQFLNTPAFMALRSIQARKELYTQTIDSFDTMIEEARKNPSAAGAPVDNAEKILVDLQEQNARLERDLAGKNETITALSSEGTGAAQRLVGLEESVSALRTENSALEESSAAKDSRITSLEAEVNRLTPEIAALNQTITARNSTISTIQEIVQIEGDLGNVPFNELRDSVERIQQALGQ